MKEEPKNVLHNMKPSGVSKQEQRLAQHEVLMRDQERRRAERAAQYEAGGIHERRTQVEIADEVAAYDERRGNRYEQQRVAVAASSDGDRQAELARRGNRVARFIDKYPTLTDVMVRALERLADLEDNSPAKLSKGQESLYMV